MNRASLSENLVWEVGYGARYVMELVRCEADEQRMKRTDVVDICTAGASSW